MGRCRCVHTSRSRSLLCWRKSVFCNVTQPLYRRQICDVWRFYRRIHCHYYHSSCSDETWKFTRENATILKILCFHFVTGSGRGVKQVSNVTGYRCDELNKIENTFTVVLLLVPLPGILALAQIPGWLGLKSWRGPEIILARCKQLFCAFICLVQYSGTLRIYSQPHNPWNQSRVQNPISRAHDSKLNNG